MSLKHYLKRILEITAGAEFAETLRSRLNPFGVDLARDIRQRLHGYRVDVVFDVGANVGQSALRYARTFKGSTIYCFEPVSASFEQLRLNVGDRKNIHCLNVALGEAHGTGTMMSHGTSTGNFLVHGKGSGAAGTQTEPVAISTVDDVCRHKDISRISYLKIDTEGSDLKVLKGSAKTLGTNAVDIVEVEAGLNPGNRYHVPFEVLKSFLEDQGYCLFGIYEQEREFPTRKPHLRRANLVFISNRMIDTYGGR